MVTRIMLYIPQRSYSCFPVHFFGHTFFDKKELQYLLFIRLVVKCLDKKIVFVISDKKISIRIITLDWLEKIIRKCLILQQYLRKILLFHGMTYNNILRIKRSFSKSLCLCLLVDIKLWSESNPTTCKEKFSPFLR